MTELYQPSDDEIALAVAEHSKPRDKETALAAVTAHVDPDRPTPPTSFSLAATGLLAAQLARAERIETRLVAECDQRRSEGATVIPVDLVAQIIARGGR